jgi:tRNA G18 (ribose-2'-O)-methylase SpoU
VLLTVPRSDCHHLHVREGDRANGCRGERLPVSIVLDRLRSAFNVGNIYRLADAVRAERIICCGYTASPPHPKLAKTARGCDSLIATERFQTAAEAVHYLRAGGVTVYGVETVSGVSPVWDVPLRFPMAFVLGNEALGIERNALELCDGCVELPSFGYKNSVNVGNCAAVVLYEALRQWLHSHPGFDRSCPADALDKHGSDAM